MRHVFGRSGAQGWIVKERIENPLFGNDIPLTSPGPNRSVVVHCRDTVLNLGRTEIIDAGSENMLPTT